MLDLMVYQKLGFFIHVGWHNKMVYMIILYVIRII